MKANCCLTASPVTYTLSNKHEMWVPGHHLKEPEINRVCDPTLLFLPDSERGRLGLGVILLPCWPRPYKHIRCHSESSGSHCCWQTHRARRSERTEEAKSPWPAGHRLTSYFAKNHTPDSDASILTSGLSQPRGLGARFAHSHVELFFLTCKIYVKLKSCSVGSNGCPGNMLLCGTHSFRMKHTVQLEGLLDNYLFSLLLSAPEETEAENRAQKRVRVSCFLGHCFISTFNSLYSS